MDERAREVVRACLLHGLPEDVWPGRSGVADGNGQEQIPASGGFQWQRNLGALVSHAYRIASSMQVQTVGVDRVLDEHDRDDHAQEDSLPLPNILAHVDIGKRTPPRKSAFPPQSNSFPVESRPGLGVGLGQDSKDSLREAVGSEIHETNLLEVLRTHLMNIPIPGVDQSTRPPVSLFQHLKSTAAIGLCTYLYMRDAQALDPTGSQWVEQLEADNLKRYLMVGGELSGIADFLSAVSSKGAMRMMRARSFYLHLLVDTAVSMIADEGELGRCCVVFSGGGAFSLLAPNTDVFREALSRVNVRLNEWLKATFGFALYFPIISVPMTAAQSAGDMGSVFSATNAAILEEENHKWSWTLPHVFDPREPASGQCDSCRQETDDTVYVDELALCTFCLDMARLGRVLPRIDVLGEVPESGRAVVSIADRHFGVEGPFKRQYLLRGSDPAGTPSIETSLLPSGSFQFEADLDLVAQASTGARRLAFLSMDVDDLTKTFRRGIAPCTMGVLGELSARVDWFVKEYVPQSLDELVARGPLGLKRDRVQVTAIYSGGDEILIVGAWDQVIDLAFGIEKRFRDYTGHNPNVTLSAGLVVVDHKIAVHKSVVSAYGEQARAKRAGKNRISLLSQAVPWSDGETIREILSLLIEQEGRGVKLTCSRSLLRALLQQSRGPEGWNLARVYYLLRRAGKPELVGSIIHRLDSSALFLSLILADLLTRGSDRSGD